MSKIAEFWNRVTATAWVTLLLSLPASAAAAQSAPMRAEDFERSLASGKEVQFRFHYDATGVNSAKTSSIYACCGNPGVYMMDGTVSLRNDTTHFTFPTGVPDFVIGRNNLLDVTSEPYQSRLHLRVPFKDKNGKITQKDFYLYNPAATASGDPAPGGPGISIICNGCDNSMAVLAQLLTWLRTPDPRSDPEGTSASAVVGGYSFSKGGRTRKSTPEDAKAHLELTADGKWLAEKLLTAGTDTGSYSVRQGVVTFMLPAGRWFRAGVVDNNLVLEDGTVLSAKNGAPAARAAASAPTLMTNEQVVQLTSAGLSDLVIGNAIREASSAAFDVSTNALVALKKSRVSDAVIMTMQDRMAKSTAAPAASTARPQANPDTGPIVANKGSAAAAQPNVCVGVEMLGLLKVDMRPASPLIVYQAKVRNGASVARIITIGWTDLYGQEKSSSAQVKAGDIATIEIGPQQPVERQPINLRVKGCQ